ncbi:IucA/IucC family protein [Streptomyces sp. NPDC004610]|uniref:IucA/IucC family protein n=1 Tax=unclassified Streptomyces TaxID=2593676 RepID=UPI0033BDAA10
MNRTSRREREERVDLIPPPAGTGAPSDASADALAAAPLLNCLLREAAEPLSPEPLSAESLSPEPLSPEPLSPGGGAGKRFTYRLLGTGRQLRVRGARRPARPEVRTNGQWQPLTHTGLVDLVAEELTRLTGRANAGLPAEMRDSRAVVAALLAARADAEPPRDPYLLSEQSLLTGHPHHPAPKARGGGPASGWLPYAPEAYARFPLTLLGLREDAVVEEGDTSALDALGAAAPPGYRPLPAHPWQLALLGDRLAPAFADGRLIRLGTTPFEVWPTAAIRTVYVPEGDGSGSDGDGAGSGGDESRSEGGGSRSEGGRSGADLFLKFSLDVRITNDIRRLWRHDLLRLRRTDSAVTAAFAAPGAPGGWLGDLGYRTADFAFEELAVLSRAGLRAQLPPGTTPYLAAALVEGFPGSPLAAATDPGRWWEAYLAAVVPPALAAFADHGVVLEAHLQNAVVVCAADGTPVRTLYRDAEGVKLVAEVGRAAGWERLVYCLVVNHLLEVAGALAEQRPGFDPWPAVRRELSRHAAVPEIPALLAAPTLPGKTNLLLRWTGADGADARYRPLPNPLRG